jgi:hypothetical protein
MAGEIPKRLVNNLEPCVIRDLRPECYQHLSGQSGSEDCLRVGNPREVDRDFGVSLPFLHERRSRDCTSILVILVVDYSSIQDFVAINRLHEAAC